MIARDELAQCVVLPLDTIRPEMYWFVEFDDEVPGRM
jgi:hypothetical protein